MDKIIYREADLDYIFIRAKRPDGSWGNLSLNELTDEQFLNWAEEKFGIEVKDDMNAKGTPWTPQQKIQFLNDMSDKLKQPAVAMIKREARHEWDKKG